MLGQVPLLRPESVTRAVVDPNSLALDAYGLLDGFRRSLLGQGGRIVNNARVARIGRKGRRWQVGFGDGTVEADIVVNAAGAWGDEIGALAGARPLGLQPLRRTALLLDVGQDVSGWPMVHRVQGGLYFKPEAGQLMVPLADETPSAPCDARPEELDVAMIAERFEEATTFAVRRLGRTWAGLRYVPAGPVAGGRIRSGGAGILLAGRSGWLRHADRAGARHDRGGAPAGARRPVRRRAGAGQVQPTPSAATVCAPQRPSTSFATMFFCTSLVPPAIELARMLN